MIGSLLDHWHRWLWDRPAADSAADRWLARPLRYLSALLRVLASGELSLRATSLVYTTLLSIVPLLALSFSMLKAMGAHNSLQPVLAQFLMPLGPRAGEISAQLTGFVERVQFGVLGTLGMVLLLFTAVSLVQKVESSFNHIWRLERGRPFARRIGEYLGVLVIGPVFLFSGLGITNTVLHSDAVRQIAHVQPLGELVYWFTRATPYLLIVGVFSFMFKFIPNTRVQPLHAFSGAVAAGLLWHAGSLAFASFVAHAINFDALYSSFSILILLLIWLYVGWLIVLTGCQLTYFLQHPGRLMPAARRVVLGGRQVEQLGLMAMSLIGHRFITGGGPGYGRDDLAEVLDIEADQLDRALQPLLEAELLVETAGGDPQLLPARDLTAIPMADIWRAVRGSGQLPGTPPIPNVAVEQLVEAVSERFDKLAPLSLREWLATTMSLPMPEPQRLELPAADGEEAPLLVPPAAAPAETVRAPSEGFLPEARGG
jgi:membrane protein